MIDLIFDTTAVEPLSKSIFGFKGAAPPLLAACDGKAVIGTGTEATPREAAEAVVCLFAEGDSFGSRDESRLAARADMAKANEQFVKSNRQANCFEAKVPNWLPDPARRAHAQNSITKCGKQVRVVPVT